MLIAVAVVIALIMVALHFLIPPRYLTGDEEEIAAANYLQYCALCHGVDRQGHVNDHAPSLKSKSLLELGYYARKLAISYGRPGTPMPGFHEDVGGPLTDDEIEQLTIWLNVEAAVDFGKISRDPVSGDVGRTLRGNSAKTPHGDTGYALDGALAPVAY